MYLSGGERPYIDELVGFVDPALRSGRRSSDQPGGRMVLRDELHQVIKPATREHKRETTTDGKVKLAGD
jgi:hypothetical protein